MSLFMGFQPLDEGVATQGRRSEKAKLDFFARVVLN